MNRKWKAPEEILYQKKHKEKMLFLALVLFTILSGISIAVLTNR
ncbi:hypothetical protein [Pseudalkalibacillus hwajinpoensis]|nr:hypothetical protein [Pseudalkalibacillus hwajinpoensis]